MLTYVVFKRKIKTLIKKDRKLNIIHSKLRNMCSSLNADLYLVNLKPSPACICGHGFEDCIPFFLECSFYNENRAILLNRLKNYVVTGNTTNRKGHQITKIIWGRFVVNRIK
jgi:hypothetical protein